MTDHSIRPEPEGTRGLHAGVWSAYNAEIAAHHEPNRFVTIHGYESSFGTPYGHHNVVCLDAPGGLYVSQGGTLSGLAPGTTFNVLQNSDGRQIRMLV